MRACELVSVCCLQDNALHGGLGRQSRRESSLATRSGRDQSIVGVETSFGSQQQPYKRQRILVPCLL